MKAHFNCEQTGVEEREREREGMKKEKERSKEPYE